ncbi:2TM domain-containing protein [Moheibacter sediminis]|uniref:Histidine kinase n=1 Tax=Moheibacter sediminis TaxID=1434700 RepID=A0A1W2BUS9_9FLAO|nr:2TM domain-containing protein [Moheibacter sediminis]SMC76755.1 hypothetical protein SAMN06296427_107169 [Moheibacter sediminis]
MKKILIHLRYSTFLVLIINTLFLVIYIINTSEIPTWNDVFSNLGWTAFFTYGLYLANAPVSLLVREKFEGNDWKVFLKRLLAGVFFSIITTIIAGSILYIIMLFINGNNWNEIQDWLLSVKSVESFQQLIWIAATISVTFHAFSFIQQFQANKLKEQTQKIVQISTEHESLKSQIGPHFLFNSLNVLNGLISENQDKAQEFVSELSSVYRYVLEQNDKSLVSLREEIDFSRTYMNLVQKRFEDGLEFEVVEDFNPNFQIVPLSLQILLENCIKHNRISSDEILKVKVYIEYDYLLIKNNLQIKNQLYRSTGKGLKNIIERYKTFTRKKVEIQQTDDEFIVKLPLLNEKITTMEIIQNYTEEEIKAAKKRVEELQGFYWNLASYVIINSFLHFLDLKDGSYDWAYWPLMGWGIGIAFHAIEVFGMFNSSSWKDRQVQKELERRKNERDRFFDNVNN